MILRFYLEKETLDMMYEKLNYVLTIAEELNLTRAAKKLYISQPTLTLYLNRLEAELGVQLFDRSRTPIVLTDAGSFYIEKMKAIYDAEQALKNDIRMIADPKQTLVIGIGQVRGHHWLPRILPKFCELYPDVNIQIMQATEQQTAKSLRTGEIDVAIGVLPSTLSDLTIVDLMYEDLYFVAHRKFGLVPEELRAQYCAEHPYTIRPESLDQLPFIQPRVTNGLYDSYEKLVLQNHIRPSRTISVSNLNTGFMLARQGLGVQLLSGSILQMNEAQFINYEELDFCVFDSMLSTRKCVAAYATDNIKKELIQTVIQIILTDILPYSQFVTPV
jgi:DNA-binding transcriptional LysR family regulator